jgi:hypothetical protein
MVKVKALEEKRNKYTTIVSNHYGFLVEVYIIINKNIRMDTD